MLSPFTLTLSKGFGVFRNHPVAALDVLCLEFGKEASNYGKNVINNVMARGAPDEKRRSIIASDGWVFVREIAQVFETCSKCFDRNTEFIVLFVWGANYVRKQKLSYRQSLGMSVEDVMFAISYRKTPYFLMSE